MRSLSNRRLGIAILATAGTGLACFGLAPAGGCSDPVPGLHEACGLGDRLVIVAGLAALAVLLALILVAGARALASLLG